VILELPLINIPQRFTISLSGVDYIIVSRWNDALESGWILDFYDADNNPLIMNIPLVTGANLLEQYAYIGIPGLIYVVADGDDYAVPTLENLGDGSYVLYETAT
jgi:hypothetical protein